MPYQELRPLRHVRESPAFLEAVLRESKQQIRGKIEQERWLVRELLSGETASFHLPQSLEQVRFMLTKIECDKGGFIVRLELPDFDNFSARVWSKDIFVPDADYARQDAQLLAPAAPPAAPSEQWVVAICSGIALLVGSLVLEYIKSLR